MNFTNWEVLNRCTNLTINSLMKSPVIWTIFDNVTCNNSRVNYTISKWHGNLQCYGVHGWEL